LLGTPRLAKARISPSCSQTQPRRTARGGRRHSDLRGGAGDAGHCGPCRGRPAVIAGVPEWHRPPQPLLFGRRLPAFCPAMTAWAASCATPLPAASKGSSTALSRRRPGSRPCCQGAAASARRPAKGASSPTWPRAAACTVDASCARPMRRPMRRRACACRRAEVYRGRQRGTLPMLSRRSTHAARASACRRPHRRARARACVQGRHAVAGGSQHKHAFGTSPPQLPQSCRTLRLATRGRQ
jgi:hypothetical protein